MSTETILEAMINRVVCARADGAVVGDLRQRAIGAIEFAVDTDLISPAAADTYFQEVMDI